MQSITLKEGKKKKPNIIKHATTNTSTACNSVCYCKQPMLIHFFDSNILQITLKKKY